MKLRSAMQALLGMGLLLPCAAEAQVVVVRGSGYAWGHFSPYDAISSRVYAQAELIRAGGAADVDYATARAIRAVAVRQEIANSVERVRAYWDRKAIGEAERMKRAYHHLESKRKRNSQTWDRLKNHPDLNGPGIVNGTALNFLLHRLSGTVLAYEFANKDAKSASQLVSQLQLTSKTLHGLNLRQAVPGGERLVFRADEGIGLRVDWWPPSLRDPALVSQRSGFEKSRQALVTDAKDGTISDEAIAALDVALLDLREAFERRSTRDERFRDGMKSWQMHKQADVFIKSLAGEIGRVRNTADASAFDGSLRFDGRDLISLLKYMSRNGLDFAPASPGEEDAYYATFAMMRDLFVTVTEDEGLEGNDPDK